MIQKFITFLHETLTLKPCTYKIHENVTYVHSMYLDIDNDVNLGRITLWDDKSCVMEVINIKTEQYLLSERYDSLSFDELIKKFDIFYSTLSQTVLSDYSKVITDE